MHRNDKKGWLKMAIFYTVILSTTSYTEDYKIRKQSVSLDSLLLVRTLSEVHFAL